MEQIPSTRPLGRRDAVTRSELDATGARRDHGDQLGARKAMQATPNHATEHSPRPRIGEERPATVSHHREEERAPPAPQHDENAACHQPTKRRPEGHARVHDVRGLPGFFGQECRGKRPNVFEFLQR